MPGSPPGDDPPEQEIDRLPGCGRHTGIGRRVGHLLGQVGDGFHGAHEVAGGQFPDVAGGHVERGGEGGAPGPRSHRGGQAGRRLTGAWHQVGLLDVPDPLGHDVHGIAAPGELDGPLVAQTVLQMGSPLAPPLARTVRAACEPGEVRRRRPTAPRRPPRVPHQRARRCRAPRRSTGRPRGRSGRGDVRRGSASSRRRSPSARARRRGDPAAGTGDRAGGPATGRTSGAAPRWPCRGRTVRSG